MARKLKRVANWLATIGLLGAVALIVLLNLPKNSDANFGFGTVTRVEPLAGQPNRRLVFVSLGGNELVLQTKGNQPQTVAGKEVCVRSSETLIGNRKRYALVLPGFCQRVQIQSKLAATDEGAYL